MKQNRKEKAYTFASGPFRATVYPAPAPRPPGSCGYAVDLYYASADRLHHRFICAGEEAEQLLAVAGAADNLIHNYLTQDRTFEQWCQDNGLHPAEPDLAD